ncbi:MAG: sigma factor-like helix-turn-helix DNA-binding protein, partial [Nitrososphaera sp.]
HTGAYNGRAMTYQEIARRLHCHRSYIQQLEASALEKLRANPRVYELWLDILTQPRRSNNIGTLHSDEKGIEDIDK